MPSRGGGRDRQNGGRLAFGFVDLLLLARFRRLDDLLLLAFGVVDRGVARAFGRQNHRALFALGAHLLFHRGQHVVRRRDVLDLVAQHLHAPGLGRLVQLLTTWVLMFVRSSNVRSRSILPISLRSVVCASCVIAKM